MKNISYRDVEIKGGYLYKKQLLNENVTINAVYNRFYDTGRIDAFNFSWTEGQDKKPHIFWQKKKIKLLKKK